MAGVLSAKRVLKIKNLKKTDNFTFFLKKMYKAMETQLER